MAPLQGAAERVEPLQTADQFEKEGQWIKACEIYEEILHRDRSLAAVRDRYQTCLRHVHLAERHRDATYRQEVLNQEVDVAVKVYGEILAKLQGNYVERERVDLTRLFHEGVEELHLALNDEMFRHEYLTGVSADAVALFQTQLGATWGTCSIRGRKEAEKQAREVARAARQALGLRAPLVVMELACGACNALDEYSVYLTPGQLNDIYASFKGEFVGVGIADLGVEGGKLVIKDILPGSPAAREHLRSGDWITRIDKKAADKLTADAALERLKGDAATTVELEVWSAGYHEPRTVNLVREAVVLRSVLAIEMLDTRLGIGYFQLTGFQETTVQEMDEAIRELKMQGMKALILDLRGNPGGMFEAAVQVAQRFLAEGVIVATQSRVPSQNKTYEANNLDVLDFPLIVLIDGETASAAEVVAGALKENRRATLVGQATYGKGSIQCVVKLDTVPAGMRITLARFFSPLGHAYTGCGVTPHIVVERTSQGFDEAQRQAALREARQLVLMRH